MMSWWEKLFRPSVNASLAGQEYRVEFTLYSQDGNREVDVCKFRGGDTYLLEREMIEGTVQPRHEGRMVGPFPSPKRAERFIVQTAWFKGQDE